MSTQPSLLSEIPALPFGGKTFVPEWDSERLTGQYRRVFDVMKDGQWRSLFQIQQEIFETTGKFDSLTGISARTRDFRKVRFGAHLVESKRKGGKTRGEWVYRLIVR